MNVVNKGELYCAKLVEASSPISKRPGTPFRFGVLGLLEEDLCAVVNHTPNTLHFDRPSDKPVVSEYVAATCQIFHAIEQLNIYIGEEVAIHIDHGENTPFLENVTTSDSSVLVRIDENGILYIRGLSEYVGEIELKADYTNCLSCLFTINVSVEKKTVVPPPPDPEPEPQPEPNPDEPRENQGVCDQVVDGSGIGYSVTNYGVVPSGTYIININILSIPDNVYVFLGNPVDGGELIASKRVTGGGWREFYFEVPTDGKELFIQFNERDSSTGTSYYFSLECDVHLAPGHTKTPLGKELPNPYNS